jgi:hypothetical protein
MSGKQIYKNTKVNSKDLVIRSMQRAKQQILLVNVECGKSVTQKKLFIKINIRTKFPKTPHYVFT